VGCGVCVGWVGVGMGGMITGDAMIPFSRSRIQDPCIRDLHVDPNEMDLIQFHSQIRNRTKISESNICVKWNRQHIIRNFSQI